MSKKTILSIKHLMFVILFSLVDQVTKYYVRTELINGKESIIIDGVLKLVSHKNTGAVWGLFSDATLILTILNIIILIAVVVFYFLIPISNKKLSILKFICVIITAGAIGNLIDRIVFGYVTDFIYFELIDFPVFNIADCYITISELAVIILFIFYYKESDFMFLKKKTTGDKNNNDQNIS